MVVTQELESDSKRIWDAVVQITFAWTNIDNSMVMLLNSLMKKDNFGLSVVIYFAPIGLDTRLSLVDKAFIQFANHFQTGNGLVELWSTAFKKINDLKSVRNKVAHGQISTIAINGKNHVRLTPAIFDTQKSQQYTKKRQIPGLSANDMETSLKKTCQMSETINLFSEAVLALHNNDNSTLLKIYSQLKERLSKVAP